MGIDAESVAETRFETTAAAAIAAASTVVRIAEISVALLVVISTHATSEQSG